MTPRAFTLRYPAPTAVAAFTPASLTGITAWYDASDTASITQVAGKVSQWNDKSGNAHHATQATALSQPDSGLHTQNGHNVVYFHQTRSLNASGLNLSQPYTAFATYNILSASDLQRIYDNSVGGARSLLNPSLGSFGAYAGSVVNVTAYGTGIVCQMVMFNGAATKHQLDGSQTTINPGTNGLDAVTIGNGPGAGSEADICDLALCSGDQSASFTTYRAYAQSYWAAP